MQTARIWREVPQRYRLEAARCKGCGKLHYPPRRVCAQCHGQQFEPGALARQGRLVAFTTIHTTQRAFVNQIPMVMAIVELNDGVRITTQVVDAQPGELKTGMPVRLEFRKIQQDGVSGVISYGHKAAPIR